MFENVNIQIAQNFYRYVVLIFFIGLNPLINALSDKLKVV